MTIVRKSNTPLLALLILGLIAALYFILTPTGSGDDSALDVSGLSELEQIDGLDGDATEFGEDDDAAIKIHRETNPSIDASVGEGIITQVKVLNPDGSGAAGVRILPWLGEQYFEEAFTNELGLATLKGLEGSGGIFITAPHRLVQHSFQEFGGALILVQLPEGQTVSGKVIFKRPRFYESPFVLMVESRPRPKWEGFPPLVRSRAYSKNALLDSIRIPIDDSGEFKIIGLPRGWNGAIRLPAGYMACSFVCLGVAEDELRWLFVSAPAKGLVLELLELPAFTGRLVSPDATVGIAQHSFKIIVSIDEDPNSAFSLHPRTDEDGYFHAPISALTMGDEWCSDPESISAQSVLFEIPARDGWIGLDSAVDLTAKENLWELGEIRMLEPAILAFRVVDQEGKPIAGAIALGSNISSPTDSDGYGEVLLAAKTAVVRVSAKGYDTIEKSLDDNLSDVMTFILPRAVRLHLSWTLADGVDMQHILLEMRSEQHVFAFGDGIMDEQEGRMRGILGLPQDGGRRSGRAEVTRAGFRIKPGQSEMDIWGLKPGIPMKVVMSGRMGGIIQESETLVFAPGEQRDLELHISYGPVDFMGKVMDASGAPLSGARVSLSTQRGGGTNATTSRDGAFEYLGIAWKKMKFGVEKEGYASLLFEEFEIPQNGESIEFTLHPARNVVVYFRDPSGKTYKSAYVKSLLETLSSANESDGGYKLSGVPNTEFSFTWYLGGLRFEQWVPVDVTELEIEVPAMASATIHATRADSAERVYLLIKFIPVGSARDDIAVYDYQRNVYFKQGVATVDGVYPALLPGNYRMEYLSSQMVNGKNTELLLAEQGPFEVAAGQVLELTLNF